ncbi:hypothetical protein [Undibacterium flavidum]|uniref:Uncharacterized protein n=1 Tax=Undibacterium flavidum TaxID=2762297 RepID=A0ABR6YDA7_9BURK|nr:hypothetical protein [Undibacterium flavidum]MBC3874545.1 hypothetical protein [Undibacterium flavidum]
MKYRALVCVTLMPSLWPELELQLTKMSGMPEEIVTLIRAGMKELHFSLASGNEAKASTMTYVGHGMAMIPTAYAIYRKNQQSLYVQAFTDPNKPRLLSQAMKQLLLALDGKIIQIPL